ncbi:MAG: hypothetical protein K0S23_459 [Fluviicola sp.]|nr:hypothetical protein [Fluviicola sp.]
MGCSQVPIKDTTTKKSTNVEVPGYSEGKNSEAGDHLDTKSTMADSCISRLEGNEVTVLMDTITAIIHVNLYCLCSDYLTGVKVKLSNKEQTYERITDKSGCDFRHIQPGMYLLEVEYEAAKKFEQMDVMVMGGAKLRWKIFLCEE